MFRLRARAGVVLSVLALASAPLFLLVTTSEVAGAAEFVVDNAGDSGAGTLRQAILDAQAGTDNVITVVPGLGTINLASELTFVSNANLTINGNGVVVNGNGTDGIIEVQGDGNLTIDGMTLTGANKTSGSELGALIKLGNDGDVTLTNCSISGNTITGGNSADVGAIDVTSGGTSITNCRINNNTITAGTGVDSGPVTSIGGPVTVTNSDISGNTVTAGANSVAAGGIDSEGGPVTVVSSSITGNTATQVTGQADTAGAIASEGGTMTIINSTISGNTAIAPQPQFTSGGLIVFASDGGIEADGLVMVYSTITNNSGGGGGNILSERNATSFGTIVSGATPNCAFGDGFAMASNGYNFTDDDTCGFTGPTDKTGPDPGLEPLGSNGGPGPTQLPILNGAVFDAIPVDQCEADGATGITTDERGVTRPQFAGCDIGAVELAPVQEIVEITPILAG